MATIRAAIYARLSVDRDGEKVGIDTQLEDSRKLARERGWEITAEYIDRNLTAADKLVTRPEYNRLVQDFGLSRFDALICWDLDRLTRQPRQLEDWIDAAEDRGLRIVTANGEADLSTDSGQMFARMKVMVGKAERDAASRRQKRNKQHRRENGLFHGGPAPFGYRTDGKTLVAVPEEVALIHEAARRLLDDREAMHSIVTDWNSPNEPGSVKLKHPTRNDKHWRQPNLRAIMLNRAMLGETKAGVKGWEPIIDQRTFDRLGALLTDPSRKATHSPGVKGGKYSMGGGLTVCGSCGKPLITQGKPRASSITGDRQVQISCLRRVNGPHASHAGSSRTLTRYFGEGGQTVRSKAEAVRSERMEVQGDTGRVTIDHDRLERYVFGRVVAALEDTPRWRQRIAESDPDVNSKIDALESERSALRDQRERAGKAFVLGVMGEREAQREVERVDSELDGIEAKINDLLARPVLANVLAEGIDWQAWAPGRRRAFLRLVIDRVIVNAWPEGMARNTFKRRDESDAEFAARRDAHLDEVLAKRVQIRWLWEA